MYISRNYTQNFWFLSFKVYYSYYSLLPYYFINKYLCLWNNLLSCGDTFIEASKNKKYSMKLVNNESSYLWWMKSLNFYFLISNFLSHPTKRSIFPSLYKALIVPSLGYYVLFNLFTVLFKNKQSASRAVLVMLHLVSDIDCILAISY